MPEWPEQEKLLQEKSALGYFFSGHPFTSYLAEVSGFAKRQLDSLEPSRDPVMLAGIVVSLRTQMTRRGKMLILLLDDATAQVEVVIFNELYEQNRHLLKDDALLVIEGKVNRDDYSGGVRVTAEKIYDLAGARTRFAQGLRLACNGQCHAPTQQWPQTGRTARALQGAGGRLPGVGGLPQPECALPGAPGRGLAGAAGRPPARVAGGLAQARSGERDLLNA